MTELPRISGPANRALDEVGITCLEDATRFSSRDLLALHGFGPKGLRILNEALQAHGLSLLSD